MTTSIIDGRVESAELRRARGGLSVFRTITFQPDRGPTRTIRNAVVKQNVADELIPAFRPSFARADEVSAHVFPYDPI